MTKIINLLGGPGAGKSSVASGLFFNMKFAGINCELVTEVAKGPTWEGNDMALACQPYIFGKQLYRQERVLGQVEYVITDSPLLLSCVYARVNGWPESFCSSVVEINNRFDNIYVYLNRTKDYVPIGRSQTEEEARMIDKKVLDIVYEMQYKFFNVNGDIFAPTEIMHKLELM